MKFKELKSKPKSELQKMLAEQRESLRGMRFRVANRSLKNVRDVRKAKLFIARLLTAIKQAAR
jgi:ribosomal protein L29